MAARNAINLNSDTDPAGQGYVTCCIFPPYFVIDFPLSLIMDTLLLPVSIPKQIIYGSISIADQQNSELPQPAGQFNDEHPF
jgi:hypothetical protein